MAYVVKKNPKPTEQPKARINNPWSAEGWDQRRQASLIRAMGPKAAQIAAAQGCTLTSTAPNPEFDK